MSMRKEAIILTNVQWLQLWFISPLRGFVYILILRTCSGQKKKKNMFRSEKADSVLRLPGIFLM